MSSTTEVEDMHVHHRLGGPTWCFQPLDILSPPD